MSETQLEQIAEDLIQRAMSAGATAADVVVREAEEFRRRSAWERQKA